MKKLRAGFTLVEVAIVVLIGGVMLEMASSMVINYMLQASISTTQSRMVAIDNALGQYLINNGAYPCPASLTTPVDTTSALGIPYGTSVDVGDCSGDPASPEAGTFQATSLLAGPPLSTRIRIGAVPVRTLNLPDQYMNDGWNDRFIYAVTEYLASPLNASVTPLYSPNGGSISVVDSIGNNVALPANSAQYAIISNGQDRVGAYTAAGVVGVPCDPATTEGLNCQQTNGQIGQFRQTLLTSGVWPNNFDDFVIFHTTSAQGVVPRGLVSPFYNLATCPTGWGIPIAVGTPEYTQLALPTIAAGPPSAIYCQKQ